MQYAFNSQVQDIGIFPCEYNDLDIKNEPMFFNSDYDFAMRAGGIITQGFLDALPRAWKNDVVIDSRVHMLMKGWFPCIPGFHHDDVPRGKNGQPDYDCPAYDAEHLAGLVNAEICPTLFALGKHYLPKIEQGIVYKHWHPIVEEQLGMKVLEPYEVPSGHIILFDNQAMHTGQRAVKDGWRWFIRVSRNTDRVKHITNEIRRQVQVYLEFPMEGW